MPTTCCRPPRSSSTWTCTSRTATPTCCSTSRRSRRSARRKPNTQIFRELAQRMGFDEPCFADDDETLARAALPGVDFDALRARRLGQAAAARGAVRRRRLSHAERQGAGRRRPASACPTTCRNYEGARSPLAARYPLAMISPPARNFLNSSFVNVRSLRDIEGEPLLEIHADDAAARGIADGTMVRGLQRPRRYRCRARVSERARPGVVNGLGIWWRKLGVDGTNVNELTSQRLTDIGRAPVVLRLPGRGAAGMIAAVDAVRRSTLLMAGARWHRGAVVLAAAALVCCTSGCCDAGLLPAVGRRPPGADAARAAGATSGWPTAPPPSALKRKLALSPAHARVRGARAASCPTTPATRATPTCGRTAVVWNVVAAPALSLTLKTWCFPVMGCVGYRGYFDEAEADALAAELRRRAGSRRLRRAGLLHARLDQLARRRSAAHTFIDWPEGELARLMFHELAHQVALRRRRHHVQRVVRDRGGAHRRQPLAGRTKAMPQRARVRRRCKRGARSSAR